MNLPINFEKVNNILDDRFIKVKIYIAHVGENRNNCIFSKEVLESMIPSLTNIPILGYIAHNEDNKEDFTSHEERLVVEDNKLKLKYMGHAYGMVPERNNAHFEFRYGDDGVEREYLVAEGILWRKFSEVEKIFDRDGGRKGHSMELEVSSVEGYTNDEGLFVFTQAKFDGLCILGEDVTPAMISSTIEKFSIDNRFKEELSDMIREFNACFSAMQEKGDEIVEDDKILKNESTVENPSEFAKKDNNKKDDSEDKAKDGQQNLPQEDNPADDESLNQQGSKKADDKSEEQNDEKDKKDSEDEENKKNKKKNFTVTFELSHEDIRSIIYQKLNSLEEYKDSWFWIVSVFDNYVIVQKDEEKFLKVNYVKYEDDISLGEFEEVFPMFLTAKEKSTIEGLRSNIESLETELKELKEFKENVELSKKEQKLSEYSTVLSKEEYDSIKSNLNKFSMEEVEREIGYVMLKNNHFSVSKQEEKQSTRVNATLDNESFEYGSLKTYFTKN